MKLLHFIADLVMLLRLYIGGFFFLVISFLLYVGLLVGQDVMIQMSENRWHFGLALLAMMIASYFLWYTSRLVTYSRELKLKSSFLLRYYKTHVPRLLAINLLGLLQLAHLHVILLNTVFTESPSELALLLITLAVLCIVNFMYCEVTRLFYLVPQTIVLRFLILLFIVLFVTVMILIQLPQEEKPSMFIVSAFSIVIILLLQIIGIYFFIDRERKMLAKTAEPWKFGLPSTEKVYFKTLNYVCGLSACFYVLIYFNFFASLAGSLAISLFAMSLMVGAINFITFINARKRINITIILIILSVLVGKFFDKYQVNLEEKDQNVFARRDSIKSYVFKWLKARNSLLANKDSFSVYFVISEGGGSRSGYWTSSVLATLADATYNDGLQFADHLMSLSGASGGSQGNATFYAMLKYNTEAKLKLDKLYHRYCRNFSSSDFLSLALARYLCFDIYTHLLPLPIPDRSRALEDSYENIYGRDHDTLISSYFKKSLSEVYDDSGKLPFFFMSTTRVKDGKPAVISNVTLPLQYYCIDLLNTLCHHDMKLSTAVGLSSRFPFLMPAGNINHEYYVDGGYDDNYGSTATNLLYQEVKQLLNDTLSNDPMNVYIRQFKNRLHFKLIHITNSLEAKKKNRLHPLVNDLAIPIISVYAVRNSSTEYLARELKLDFRSDQQVDVFLEKNIPMNLVISDFYLHQMDSQLNELVIHNDSLMKKMNVKYFNVPEY